MGTSPPRELAALEVSKGCRVNGPKSEAEGALARDDSAASCAVVGRTSEKERSEKGLSPVGSGGANFPFEAAVSASTPEPNVAALDVRQPQGSKSDASTSSGANTHREESFDSTSTGGSEASGELSWDVSLGSPAGGSLVSAFAAGSDSGSVPRRLEPSFERIFKCSVPVVPVLPWAFSGLSLPSGLMSPPWWSGWRRRSNRETPRREARGEMAWVAVPTWRSPHR